MIMKRLLGVIFLVLFTASSVAAVESVNDLSALKAAVTTTSPLYMVCRTVNGDGGHGVFRWDSANLSTKVTTDPLNGVYVPPNSDTTGASGAWVRQYDDVINVKWFGAKGDGVTDDTATFKAVEAAIPSAGGTIFIPDGIFLLNKATQSEQFAITKSNVTLSGNGNGSVLKHTATGVVTGNNAVVMIRPISGDIYNTTIKNLRIVGPTTNTGAAIFGDSRVLGILIHDGVSDNGIYDTLIDNVIIEGMETACFGITAGPTKRVWRTKIINSTAKNSRQDGFNDFSGGVFDVIISNCFAFDLDGFGMEISSSGAIITDNIIKRTGQSGIGMEYSVSLGAAYRTVISNNLITDIGTAAYPNSDGISLGQSGSPYNTDVMNNSIYRVGGHGITVNLTPRDINIAGNTIVDVGKNNINKVGITTGAAGTNLNIHDNVIRNVDTANYHLNYGIALAGTASATNRIRDNEVTGASITPVAVSYPTRSTRQFIKYPGVGNIGGGEDNLVTHTIAANTILTDGQHIKITAWGETAANSNNKRVKLWYHGTAIADTGVAASNNKAWRIEALVYRNNSSIHQYSTIGQFNGSTMQTIFGTSGGGEWNVDNIVKCTGEAVADNDIIQHGMLIEYSDPY
jgi:hypothetical protein